MKSEIEKQKKLERSKNIIIHHVHESSTWELEKLKEKDRRIALGIFQYLGVKTEIKYMKRIGIRKAFNIRSLKDVLRTEEEVETILANVWKLKDSGFIDEFSITEDLTEEERKAIKEMNAEAKERTKQKKIKQE